MLLALAWAGSLSQACVNMAVVLANWCENDEVGWGCVMENTPKNHITLSCNL